MAPGTGPFGQAPSPELPPSPFGHGPATPTPGGFGQPAPGAFAQPPGTPSTGPFAQVPAAAGLPAGPFAQSQVPSTGPFAQVPAAAEVPATGPFAQPFAPADAPPMTGPFGGPAPLPNLLPGDLGADLRPSTAPVGELPSFGQSPGMPMVFPPIGPVAPGPDAGFAAGPFPPPDAGFAPGQPPVTAGPYGSPMAPASAGPLGAPMTGLPKPPPPRRLDTFTDEGTSGVSSTFSRPGMRRTSAWVYVTPLVLLLAGAGVWWFLGRDVPADEVATVTTPDAETAIPGDAALGTAGAAATAGTAGTADTAGTAGTSAIPGAGTTAGAATAGTVGDPTVPGVAGSTTSTTPTTPGTQPGPGTPGTTVPVPTGKTPVPGTPVKKPVSKPKTTPKPKTDPAPSKTKNPDPYEKRRDQAEKADPGRIIMELEMLSAAKKALKTSPNQSLAYIDQHHKEFPVSQLTDQFDEVRIKALCALGKGAQARSEATAILKKRPTSRVGAAIKECKV